MSEAAKAEPDSPYFLNGRGMAYAKAGQAKEAEADFSQASTLARDAMTLNNICYSKAYQGVGLQHALADCERSLTLSPDVPGTLDSRGTVFLRLGWLDEAIGDFDKVIAKTPGMAQLRYLRAVARSKKGDLAGAREDVEAARKESAETVADLERQGFVLAMENAS